MNPHESDLDLVLQAAIQAVKKAEYRRGFLDGIQQRCQPTHKPTNPDNRKTEGTPKTNPDWIDYP